MTNPVYSNNNLKRFSGEVDEKKLCDEFSALSISNKPFTIGHVCSLIEPKSTPAAGLTVRQIVVQPTAQSNGEKILSHIFYNAHSKFKVLSSNTPAGKTFELDMYLHFKKLLSKPLGQSLITDLLKCGKKIEIKESNKCLMKVKNETLVLKFCEKQYDNTLFFVLDTKDKLRLSIGSSYLGLAHELCHLYNEATGRARYTKVKDPSGMWTSMEEMYAIIGYAVYLGNSYMPYNPYNENAFRALFGLPSRIYHVGQLIGMKYRAPLMSIEEWNQQVKNSSKTSSVIK